MATIRKELGKISAISFGRGGYQDCMLGLTVKLTFGGSCCVNDFKGFWDTSMKVTERTQWNEGTRDAEYAKTMRLIDKMLHEAKKDDITKLVGVPVEVTLEGMCLKEWRILTEVI